MYGWKIKEKLDKKARTKSLALFDFSELFARHKGWENFC
ncbi:hypothetical protein STRMA_0455 [Streptococcus macacae NCTC 11558]|uniref:Uncharacterized protein n=1 Tax=Streptococcus macacae NCTC 11558 TaxID=764298 RepID=G5JZ38_9STRE|nr:hypothetical protein STRMA_0455 [Streptococcus macacae NCTC 11558]